LNNGYYIPTLYVITQIANGRVEIYREKKTHRKEGGWEMGICRWGQLGFFLSISRNYILPLNVRVRRERAGYLWSRRSLGHVGLRKMVDF